MRKKTLIIFAFIINLSLILPGFGTELPIKVVELIKENFSGATIRFDGLIELPDGNKYLPVLPIKYENTDNSAKIIQTIPANASINSKPDMILFSNNLALLKIIQKPNGVLTLLNSKEIPLKVKLGILPQDFVVPEKMIIPLELRVIIGDLKINTSDDFNKAVLKKQDIPTANKNLVLKITQSDGASNLPELIDLVNNTFYATSLQSNLIYIINSQTGRPVKVIELSSIPSDIAITADKRYILATCLSSNKVSIVDTSNNNHISDIDVGKLPASLVISKGTNKAYIANRLSGSISVIDIYNMSTINEIKVNGSPNFLALSEDENSIFYNDSYSGNVYKIDLNSNSSNNEIKLITKVNNVSKMVQFGKYLLAISRTDNTLNIFDLIENKTVKTLEVGNKPVDLVYYPKKSKIYVLSADSHTLSIIDPSSFEITKKIELNDSGFPKNINILAGVDKALISNANTYEIVIIDLNQERVADYMPVVTTINSMVVTQADK